MFYPPLGCIRCYLGCYTVHTLYNILYTGTTYQSWLKICKGLFKIHLPIHAYTIQASRKFCNHPRLDFDLLSLYKGLALRFKCLLKSKSSLRYNEMKHFL